MRVEESVEIARSPQEVWALVADPLNDPRWCRKVTSVEQSGPRAWRVVHKPVPLRPPAELRLEHLELDAPSRLRMREEDEASVFDVEYRLEPTPAGTRFTQVSEFDLDRFNVVTINVDPGAPAVARFDFIDRTGATIHSISFNAVP